MNLTYNASAHDSLCVKMDPPFVTHRAIAALGHRTVGRDLEVFVCARLVWMTEGRGSEGPTSCERCRVRGAGLRARGRRWAFAEPAKWSRWSVRTNYDRS